MQKILIVEDRPEIRTMVRIALQGHFEVDEAGTAEEALARIRQDPPAGIVLDVMLAGGMNGIELCELIKRDARLDRIHVVVTTGNYLVDSSHAHAREADRVFIKPFSPLSLLRHLSGALLRVPARMER